MPEVEKESKSQKLSYQELASLDPVLTLIKEKLTQHFKIERLFLFGSRAQGKSSADSDYDLLIVANDLGGSRIENLLTARRILADLNISADVFIYNHNEFEEWKNELNSIPEVAHTLGVEIPLG